MKFHLKKNELVFVQFLIAGLESIIVVCLILYIIRREPLDVFIADIKNKFFGNFLLLAIIIGVAGIIFLFLLYSFLNCLGLVQFWWHVRIGKKNILLGNCTWVVRYLKHYVMIVACLILAIVIFNIQKPRQGSIAWEEYKVVRNGLGIIDEYTETNSLEAFRASYNMGCRMLEIDLRFSSDGKLVCVNDWDAEMQKGIDKEHIPTEDDFKKARFYDIYTPLSFEDICNLLAEYRDVYVVVDMCNFDTDNLGDVVNCMVDTAKKNGSQEVLDSFIIQINNEAMLGVLEKIYQFKNIIFSTKNQWEGDAKTFAQYCRFCAAHNISMISIPSYEQDSQIYQLAKNYGIDVFIYTINSLSEAKSYLKDGATGVFSDFLIKEDLE